MILIVFITLLKTASAELWAVKSYSGGGYAGRAVRLQGEIVMSGTVWDSRFSLNGTTIGRTSNVECYVSTLKSATSLASPQSCISLATAGDHVAVLGFDKVTDILPHETDHVRQVMALVDVRGGTVHLKEFNSQTLPFQLPMDAAAENGQNIFVATLRSTEVPDAYQIESSDLEDLSVFQYGIASQTDAIRWGKASLETDAQGGVQKLNAVTGALDWYTPLVGDDNYQGDVMVTAVAYLPRTRLGKFVLAAGSTKASGSMLGTNVGFPVRGGGDWDGFVTKLDPQTGQMASPPSGHDASYRIQSVGNANDWVAAICFQHPDHVFVVGHTDGKVASNHLDESGGAFVIKIDIDTMEVEWKIQLEGLGVLGTACAVAEDQDAKEPDLLFVGGVLPSLHPGLDLKGKKLPEGQRNTEDAFVIAINADSSTGQIEWIRELEYTRDGPRNEAVSSLSLDPTNGHVVVTGNSYDPRIRQNDVFVVAIDRQTGSAGSLDSFQTVPETKDSTALGRGSGASVSEGAMLSIIAILALLLAALIVFGAGCYRRRTRSKVEKIESKDAFPDPVAVDKSIV